MLQRIVSENRSNSRKPGLESLASGLRSLHFLDGLGHGYPVVDCLCSRRFVSRYIKHWLIMDRFVRKRITF